MLAEQRLIDRTGRGVGGRCRVAMLCVSLVLHAALLQGCISYRPAALADVAFEEYIESETRDDVRVAVAAFGRKDAQKLFPVNLAKHGIQPVWIEVENNGERRYAFFQQSVDPKYFAPSEAAYRSHSEALGAGPACFSRPSRTSVLRVQSPPSRQWGSTGRLGSLGHPSR